jgi:quinoprotein glucose dehydrogenase
VLATDVDFGPDGAIYLSDWVNGWNGEGKGRIYKFSSAEHARSPVVQQVKRLLAEGFSQRPVDELVSLLSHADRRIRQEAQFALVDKQAADALALVAKTNASQLARVHAIWGLEQLGRRGGEHRGAPSAVLPLVSDADAEVRAQAAKVLGEGRVEGALEELVAVLKDESARVRYFAAQSLGNLGRREAIEPLLALLEENADQDAVLRHAAVMGLFGASGGSAEALLPHASHASSAARMGVLLALRRIQSPQIAVFLNDADPRLVTEAARAIYDLPIEPALPQLAALLSRSTQDDALIRRTLAANYRLGTAEAARAIVAYAAWGTRRKPCDWKPSTCSNIGRSLRGATACWACGVPCRSDQ